MEIVGFWQKVDDDINKLICKFVGLPVHPIAKALKIEICRIYKIKTFGKFELKYFCQSIFDEITLPKTNGGKQTSSKPMLRHNHCCYYRHDWNCRLNPKLTGIIYKKFLKEGDLKTERCYYCKKQEEYYHVDYNNLNGYIN